jgi:hypothetical protein
MISVKGKGLMETYFVLGKNASQLDSPVSFGMPAGVPQPHTPSSVHRQTQAGSLAAVVLQMQASNRNTISNNVNTTREF